MSRAFTRKLLVPAFPALLLAAMTLAVYWPTLGHEFLTGWDDPTYITKNEAIRGFTWEHLKTAFTSYYVGNYAPVQILSYMLDYTFWGMRASGFLLTNVLLHSANGVFLYLLIHRLYGRKLWPFLACLLFLLHPLQVESVAWLSQRKNLLALFFFLPALHWYIIYREDETNRRLTFYLLSIASFTIALLAKSIAVILPPVLILYTLCYRARQRQTATLVDILPYFIAAAAVALLALQSQAPEFDGGRVHAYWGGSLLNTIFTMLPVLASYLGKLFWPVDLSAWYDPLIRSGIDMTVVLSALLFLTLIVVGVVLWQRKRDLFFWYALFFIGLIPVSQIVPLMTLMNDRYLYFPLMGAAPFICALLLPEATLADLAKPGRQIVLASGLFLTITVCTALTIRRAAVWQDSITLWSDTVKKAPDVYITHHGLGCAFLKEGRVDEAITELTRALEIARLNEETLNQLGICYGKKGDFDKAIELFNTVLKINPASEPAKQNLATALYGKKQFGQK